MQGGGEGELGRQPEEGQRRERLWIPALANWAELVCQHRAYNFKDIFSMVLLFLSCTSSKQLFPGYITHSHFGLGMAVVLVTFLSRQRVEGRVDLVSHLQRDESLS